MECVRVCVYVRSLPALCQSFNPQDISCSHTPIRSTWHRADSTDQINLCMNDALKYSSAASILSSSPFTLKHIHSEDIDYKCFTILMSVHT